MRKSVLFGAKNFGVLETYGVSTRTSGEGVKPVQTFCRQKEKKSIFRDFVRTSFMDGPYSN